MSLILDGNATTNKNKEGIQLVLLILFVLGLFLPIKTSNITLILLAAYWLFAGDYKNFSIKRAHWIFLLLAGFYMLHVVALSYSDTPFKGFKELEKKIPMLALPIMIACIHPQAFSRYWNHIARTFIVITIAVCFLLYMFALWRYSHGSSSDVFYYSEFSNADILLPFGISPIYLSIYVLFAFCLFMFNRPWTAQTLSYDLTAVGVTFFLLILLSSKTALAVFIALTLYILYCRLTHINTFWKIMILVAAASLIIFLIQYFPTTRARIQNAMESNLSGIWDDDYTTRNKSFTGPTIRLSFWKIALKEMRTDNIVLLGVGPGDQTEYMNNAYSHYGLIEAGYENYNLHNTFLETFLELGIIGTLYLFAMLISMLLLAMKQNNKTLLCLLFIFTLFSMTEAVLNVNKGIAFFFLAFPLIIKAAMIEKSTETRQA